MSFYEWQHDTLVLDPGYFAFDHPVLAINKQKAQIGQMGQDATGTVGGITLNNVLLGLGGLAGGYFLAKMFLGGEKSGISMNPDDPKKRIKSTRDIDVRFIKAAANGNRYDVMWLAKQGADIHAENDLALKFSVMNGHLPVVKFLVGKGVDIHIDNDYALRWAAHNGHLSIVRFIVSKEASATPVSDYAVEDAIGWATMNGYSDIVDLLKKYASDRKWDINNNPNNELNSALLDAIRSGNVVAVRVLIRRGADVNFKKGSPLKEASRNGHIEIVRSLINHGANPNLGVPLADVASAPKNVIPIAKILMKHFAEEDGTNGEPLVAAIANGNYKLVELLIANGADVHFQYNRPIQEAKRRMDPAILDLVMYYA